MDKKTTKAISALKSYLPELDNIQNAKDGNTWKAKLHDTLSLYIGQEAAVTKRLDKLFFTDKEIKVLEGTVGYYDEYVFNPKNKEDFRNLVYAAIRYIEQNGIKDNYVKSNFLSQFNTTQILGGVLLVGNIVFWSGWFVGETQKDREVVSIQSERDAANKNLADLKIVSDSQKKELDQLQTKHIQDSLQMQTSRQVMDSVIWANNQNH